ncbi:MAG: ribonuclease H-like domain-containing protein [Bacteroidota bacterium]
MFSQAQLENVLFLDIETASVVASYEELPERMQGLWDKKAGKYQRNEADREKAPAQIFGEKAGIHAEFAKVVCISCGILRFEGTTPSLRLKSFFGEDEGVILREFREMLDPFMKAKGGRNLCAHNGKEFDFPFLGRRYLIQGQEIPKALQIQGKKPWEISFIDTMELWKFGDYKAYTSLDLLSAVLGVPSPKDDIDGSQVGRVFWEEKDHERIKVYCEKDVRTTAQVVLRMSRMPLLAEEVAG